jgi:hypothetical protein
VTWAWAIATCRGTSHIRDNTECQDTSRCIAVGSEKQILVAVVSDGAGTATHGKQGSVLVCRTVSECARQHFATMETPPTDDDVWFWIDQTRDRISLAAKTLAAAQREFAATLVAVIGMVSETLLIHIGDGAAVCKTNSSWIVPSWPAHGEYASTTYFITDEPVANLRITRLPFGVDAMAAFSDGIERLVLRFADQTASETLFDKFTGIVRASNSSGTNKPLNESLKRYLDSPVINERTDDDKSLIVAVRI